MRNNQFLLHIFIQWLTDKNILDLWIDEMLNEDPKNGFSIETRATRLSRCYTNSLIITHSFSLTRSIQGMEFWTEIQRQWKQYHFHYYALIEKAAASLPA